MSSSATTRTCRRCRPRITSSADLAGAIAKAVNAGVDMSMEVFDADQWQAAILQDVATGAISQARIDEAVGGF